DETHIYTLLISRSISYHVLHSFLHDALPICCDTTCRAEPRSFSAYARGRSRWRVAQMVRPTEAMTTRHSSARVAGVKKRAGNDKIGRASCRERVEIAVVGVSVVRQRERCGKW